MGKNAIMDGLKPDGKGNYLFSDYNGRLFRASKNGEITELLDTTTPQTTLADFEYIIDKKMLIIPTLWDNKIISYTLK